MIEGNGRRIPYVARVERMKMWSQEMEAWPSRQGQANAFWDCDTLEGRSVSVALSDACVYGAASVVHTVGLAVRLLELPDGAHYPKQGPVLQCREIWP